MKRSSKISLVLLIAMFLAVITTTPQAQAAPVVTPTVVITPSLGTSHDLIIKDVDSSQGFTVCSHWGSQYAYTVDSSGCDGGGLGWLAPGEDTKTKFGWDDADAVRIPANYILKQEVPGVNVALSLCRTFPLYKKVSADVLRKTRQLYLAKGRNCRSS
jgi:hypothetical protein